MTTTINKAELAEAMTGVLAELFTVHEELLELMREHRRAISRCDAAAIQEGLSRQGILGVRATDLERTRQRVAAALTGRPRASIADIAAGLSVDSRAPMLAAADRLRAVLGTIQKESGVIRAATHTLIAHIDGLMRQVAQALNHAGTYGRQGRVERAGPLTCRIDMAH